MGSIAKLGIILDASEVGLLITSEHAAFKGYSVSIFNQTTQRHGIEYVLYNIEGHNDLKSSNEDREYLRRKFEIYESNYKKSVGKNLVPDEKKLQQNIQSMKGDLLTSMKKL
jgi:hypothetical protein